MHGARQLWLHRLPVRLALRSAGRFRRSFGAPPDNRVRPTSGQVAFDGSSSAPGHFGTVEDSPAWGNPQHQGRGDGCWAAADRGEPLDDLPANTATAIHESAGCVPAGAEGTKTRTPATRSSQAQNQEGRHGMARCAQRSRILIAEPNRRGKTGKPSPAHLQWDASAMHQA